MRLPERPDWAKDQIKNDVQIFLGWRDRLKILFGFSIDVDVFTNCENVPGRVEAIVGIAVRRPLWWPRRNRLGYGFVEVERPHPPADEAHAGGE